MASARLAGAIDAVGQAMMLAMELPPGALGVDIDADFIDDLSMHPMECESLRLTLEEIFGCNVPPDLWKTPMYRTAESMAEWLVRHSTAAAWKEAKKAHG